MWLAVLFFWHSGSVVMNQKTSRSRDIWIALAIVGVLIFPVFALTLAFFGVLLGILWGLVHVIAKPAAQSARGYVQRAFDGIEDVRSQRAAEHARQELMFDTFMRTLVATHTSMTNEQIDGIRLSLEMLVRQHPGIHDQISPELLRELLAQHLTGEIAPHRLMARARFMEGEIARLIAPPVHTAVTPQETIDEVLTRHQERLSAIQMLPDDPEYNVDGMIEDERNRFLDEVNAAFGDQQ